MGPEAAARHYAVTRGPRSFPGDRALLALALLLVCLALASGVPVPARGAEPPPRLDIPYGASSPFKVLDVHGEASSGTPAPVVVMVHGGGWRGGDKADLRPAAAALAARGFVVFNVNYRLGSAGSPAYIKQVADVMQALAWVRRHAPEYGGDPESLGLVGGSAGGHLAALVATSVGAPRVRAAVSLSGPMDIRLLVANLREGAASCSSGDRTKECEGIRLARSDLQALLGCPPLSCPADVLEAASPAAQVTRSTPPFFIANSANEVLPPTQAQAMALALRARDVDYELHILPGDEHSVAYARLLAGDVLEFLRVRLAPPVSTSRPSPSPDPIDQEPTDRTDRPPSARWTIAGVLLVAVLLAAAVVTRRRGARKSSGPGPRADPSR